MASQLSLPTDSTLLVEQLVPITQVNTDKKTIEDDRSAGKTVRDLPIHIQEILTKGFNFEIRIYVTTRASYSLNDPLNCLEEDMSIPMNLLLGRHYQAVLDVLDYEVPIFVEMPTIHPIPIGSKPNNLLELALDNYLYFLHWDGLPPNLRPQYVSDENQTILFLIIKKILEKHQILFPHTDKPRFSTNVNNRVIEQGTLELIQLFHLYGLSYEPCKASINEGKWWRQYNHPKVIDFLISQKANIYQTAPKFSGSRRFVATSDINPLHRETISTQNINTIKRMLNLGMPFDSLNYAGNTAEEYLRERTNFMYNIDPIKSKNILNLLSSARELFIICSDSENYISSQGLENAKRNLRSALTFLTQAGKIDCDKTENVSVEFDSENADTKGNADTKENADVKVKLEFELVKNLRNKGMTALHLAIKSNAPSWVIEELLSHGADPLSTVNIIPSNEKMDDNDKENLGDTKAGRDVTNSALSFKSQPLINTRGIDLFEPSTNEGIQNLQKSNLALLEKHLTSMILKKLTPIVARLHFVFPNFYKELKNKSHRQLHQLLCFIIPSKEFSLIPGSEQCQTLYFKILTQVFENADKLIENIMKKQVTAREKATSQNSGTVQNCATAQNSARDQSSPTTQSVAAVILSSDGQNASNMVVSRQVNVSNMEVVKASSLHLNLRI